MTLAAPLLLLGAMMGTLALVLAWWWTNRERWRHEAWADAHGLCAECGRDRNAEPGKDHDMENVRIRRLMDELTREISMENSRQERSQQLTTQVVPLMHSPRHMPAPFQRLHTLIARPQRPCRPYRLVFDTDAPKGWVVTSVEVGGSSLLPSVGDIPVAAFTPLPTWILQSHPKEAEHLEQLRKEFPLSNIEPISLLPGIQVTVTIFWEGHGDATILPDLPRGWLLAQVPELL